MKKISHLIEAAIVHLLILIFRLLPFTIASNIGGFLGRKIGPITKVNRTARNNIKLAMPELSDAHVEEILDGMWDNLGRNVTEFPHVKYMTPKKLEKIVIKFEGREWLNKLSGTTNAFLATGHFANWELMGPAAVYKGCKLHVIYRKANNPYVDKIIRTTRDNYQTDSSPKGTVGARKTINSIKKGLNILMLLDQKQNDGIAVPFFGVPAMTAPAIATMALKYDCTIFPARLVRIKGSKFKYIFEPEIVLKKTGNDKKDTLEAMTKMNQIFEGWIRDYPEQWFWVHNRWPKGSTRA